MPILPPVPSPTLQRIDHLVFVAPDLATGAHHVESLLGVAPGPGGRHPQWGTHNVLWALGESTYLEVIARDPELPAPPAGVLFGLGAETRPRLLTWVLRDEDLRTTWSRAAADAGLGGVESGSRRTPDGRELQWNVTDPAALPCDGCAPFLIGWGQTPHPADSAPQAGTLLELRLEHPSPDTVRRALDALSVDLEVHAAPHPRVAAVIRGTRGTVTLE